MDKKNTSIINKLTNIFFVGALVSFAAMLASGCYVLITYLNKDKNGLYEQIVISELHQENKLSLFNSSIYPGESKDFKVDISSNLVEKVEYSFNFSNHTVNENDKYFYVSVKNSKNEKLINNTLDEIFNNNLSASKQFLDSYGKEALIFTFSISSILSEKAEYNFDINFKAEARIINL